MSFEFNGEKYAKASTHQKEWGNKIIGELKLKGNETILDLGCGDGALTFELSQRVPDGKVIGIDASEGMISVAKNKEYERLEFKIMDINNIQIEEKVNLIFSNAALHWVKNHERLLETCYSILKKDGMIRFNFAGDGNCQNYFKVVKVWMNKAPYCQYFKDFEWPWYMPSIEDYKTLIGKIGNYTSIKIWGENADRYFQSQEALIGWIDQPSLVPFMVYLPEGYRESFRTGVIQDMLNLTGQADGTYFETFRRINIEMIK